MTWPLFLRVNATRVTCIFYPNCKFCSWYRYVWMSGVFFLYSIKTVGTKKNNLCFNPTKTGRKEKKPVKYFNANTSHIRIQSTYIWHTTHTVNIRIVRMKKWLPYIGRVYRTHYILYCSMFLFCIGSFLFFCYACLWNLC